MISAPHSSAKLMKLRQSESLGILYEHDDGIRHIDTDLDHGGGYEKLYLALSEAAHDVFLIGTLHASVEDTDIVSAKLPEREGGGIFLCRCEV